MQILYQTFKPLTIYINLSFRSCIFSKSHSSNERDYKSANTITFQAMEQAAALFGRATFVMDRDYDDNKMFLKSKQTFFIKTANPIKKKVFFSYYRLAKDDIPNASFKTP